MKMVVAATQPAQIDSMVRPRKLTIGLCTRHDWNTQLPEGVSLSLPPPLPPSLYTSRLNA